MVRRAGCPALRAKQLLKNSVARRVAPSAAKAGTENKAFIAAVNCCATQKQDQNRVFQQSVKPTFLAGLGGTAEAVLFPKPFI
jgi:hypothetical protein